MDTLVAQALYRAKGKNLARRVAELEQRLAAAEVEAATLRESEAVWRELIELSPDAIFISDKERRIVLINPRGAALFGAAGADDIIGRKASEFVHPDARAMIAGAATELRNGRRQNFLTEVRRRRLDGSEFCADIAAAAIRWKGEAAVLVVVRDISPRKQAEAEAAAAQKHPNDAIESLSEGDRAVACRTPVDAGQQGTPQFLPRDRANAGPRSPGRGHRPRRH